MGVHGSIFKFVHKISVFITVLQSIQTEVKLECLIGREFSLESLMGYFPHSATNNLFLSISTALPMEFTELKSDVEALQ